MSQPSTARSGNEDSSNFRKEVDRIDRKCAEIELQSKSIYKENSEKMAGLEESVLGLKKTAEDLKRNQVAPEFIESKVNEMQQQIVG